MMDLVNDWGMAGFRRVGDLAGRAPEGVPKGPGVYVVVRPFRATPEFLDTSPAGWFKDQDPTVLRSELAAAWVPDAELLYVGKTGGLRTRIGQLLAFGAGKPVGHAGGRTMWQLADAADFLVAWCEAEDYQGVASDLMAAFESQHGALPFANRVRTRAAVGAAAR